MLLASGAIALWIWTLGKAQAAKNATLAKIMGGLNLGGGVATTTAAAPNTPADPTGPAALGYVAQG